jgi:hypothetical protein
MSDVLKISPRVAGHTALESYCPRCFWYRLRLKTMPFSIMPGIMFRMERMEKAYMLAEIEKNGCLPAEFKPFNDCKEPVVFPFAMEAPHPETGVIVTARPDWIHRKRNGNLALLDLKTSDPNGGGRTFHAGYEIQVIGYSWVAEAHELGKIDQAGLIFAYADVEAFEKNPLVHRSETGIVIPFRFEAHEVKLEYSRLTKALIEAKRIWELSRPPEGREGCKDCKILLRVFDLEEELRTTSRDLLVWGRYYKDLHYQQSYFRELIRMQEDDMQELQKDAQESCGNDSIWTNWDFD